MNGENTAPVYKFLKATKSSGLLGSLLGDNVKWNFEKFLVDQNGQVVQRYDPTVAPLKIEVKIHIVNHGSLPLVEELLLHILSVCCDGNRAAE